jgi:hypothetical protein
MRRKYPSAPRARARYQQAPKIYVPTANDHAAAAAAERIGFVRGNWQSAFKSFAFTLTWDGYTAKLWHSARDGGWIVVIAGEGDKRLSVLPSVMNFHDLKVAIIRLLGNHYAAEIEAAAACDGWMLENLPEGKDDAEFGGEAYGLQRNEF